MWLANGVVAIHLTIEGNKKTTEPGTLVVNSSEQRKRDHTTGFLIAIESMLRDHRAQTQNVEHETRDSFYATQARKRVAMLLDIRRTQLLSHTL